MAQNTNNHDSNGLIDTAAPPADTRESLLKIVQDFKWLVDHKIDKQRIAYDLLSLDKPKTNADRDRLARLCAMYLNAVMYEAAKYAGQSSAVNHDLDADDKSQKTTSNIGNFCFVHITEFTRRNADGHWQICRVADDGTVSIQDMTWYDAEKRVKEVLTEHTVLQTVTDVLNEDKDYFDDDKTRVAADIIDAIAREVA